MINYSQFEGDFGIDLKDFLTRDNPSPKDWALISARAIAPFDGCIWRWNYWALQKNLQITALIEDMPKYFTKKGNTLEEFISNFMNTHYWKDFEIRYVDEKTDLISTPYVVPGFYCEVHNALMDQALIGPRARDAGEEELWAQFKCSCCGELKGCTPATHEGDYYGCGGVAVSTDRIYCEDCMSESCVSCDHPLGNVDSVEVSEEVADAYGEERGGYCLWCVPEHRCSECNSYRSIIELFANNGKCELCAEAAERGE